VDGLARDQLRMIAEQTGGRMYSPRGAEDLSRVYSEIADDLKRQYQIAYSPGHHGRDGKWHEIRVRIKNTEGASVRTRTGYVAKSDPADSQPK
jgi:Ca-activated chloride channel homolog